MDQITYSATALGVSLLLGIWYMHNKHDETLKAVEEIRAFLREHSRESIATKVQQALEDLREESLPDLPPQFHWTVGLWWYLEMNGNPEISLCAKSKDGHKDPVAVIVIRLYVADPQRGLSVRILNSWDKEGKVKNLSLYTPPEKLKEILKRGLDKFLRNVTTKVTHS